MRKDKADCPRYASRLNDYVDGRLSADATWRIKNHVTICASCAETVHNLSSVARLLGEAPKHEVSASFTAALEARIAANPRSAAQPSVLRRFFNGMRAGLRGFNRNLLPLTAPFAAAAVVAVMALLFVHPNYPPITSHLTASNVTVQTAEISDPAVVQTCMNQHRDEASIDPLADTSAQLLSTSVDTLPVDTSKSQNLSDDDAAVLLDEEM